MLPGALKILHSPLVFLRGSARAKGPEILAFSRFGVFFSEIKAILA
jgi:hypothetical protein